MRPDVLYYLGVIDGIADDACGTIIKISDLFLVICMLHCVIIKSPCSLRLNGII